MKNETEKSSAPSIPVAAVLNVWNEWIKNHKGQRFGQYLMNTLLPKEVNSEIFYQEDPKKAMKIFLATYD